MTQKLHVSRGLVSASRIISIVLFAISCLWLWFYFESLRQRHKAESLFWDLKSFPLGSADFTRVRNFALTHGGTAIQEFPPSLPTLGLPVADYKGQMQVPSVWTKPRCTNKDCVFEVWIKPSAETISLSYPSEIGLLSAMTCAGIRPWGAYATFEIVDGRLERLRASVGGFVNDKSGDYEGLIPLEYEVISENPPVNGDVAYSVGRSHVTGGPLEILQTRVMPTRSLQVERAFDVNLRCLTRVSHGCSFSELAPSAWNDYQHQLTPDRRQ